MSVITEKRVGQDHDSESILILDTSCEHVFFLTRRSNLHATKNNGMLQPIDLSVVSVLKLYYVRRAYGNALQERM